MDENQHRRHVQESYSTIFPSATSISAILQSVYQARSTFHSVRLTLLNQIACIAQSNGEFKTTSVEALVFHIDALVVELLNALGGFEPVIKLLVLRSHCALIFPDLLMVIEQV